MTKPAASGNDQTDAGQSAGPPPAAGRAVPHDASRRRTKGHAEQGAQWAPG